MRWDGGAIAPWRGAGRRMGLGSGVWANEEYHRTILRVTEGVEGTGILVRSAELCAEGIGMWPAAETLLGGTLKAVGIEPGTPIRCIS